MIWKSAKRFSEKVMCKQAIESAMAIQPNLVAL
jgi:hypothetical protein